MKEKIRIIIEDNTSPKGKVFDYFIQILILLSLVAFTIETLPDNSANTIAALEAFELICVIIFSIEYLLRVFVSKKPFQYIFSFYGVIDFLAIFPFYLRGAYDLRALRAFRIFRIFRALKLIRYNKALNRFHIAVRIVKEEILLFFMDLRLPWTLFSKSGQSDQMTVPARRASKFSAQWRAIKLKIIFPKSEFSSNSWILRTLV